MLDVTHRTIASIRSQLVFQGHRRDLENESSELLKERGYPRQSASYEGSSYYVSDIVLSNLHICCIDSHKNFTRWLLPCFMEEEIEALNI